MKKLQRVLATILVCCLLLNSTSCSKSEEINQQKIISPTLSNNIIIDIYKESLSKDADFIKMIHLETQIKEVLLDGFNNDNGLQLLNIEKSLTTANTNEEMILAFSLNGINNGKELVNLFQNKVDLLKNIINKFPNLHQLNAQEMIELYKYSRAVILNPSKEVIHPFSDNKTFCMRAFEVGMSDCEDDYQSALANSFETTAIALFTGGPLAATLTAAITAYSAVKALHTCTDRTIRNYTICNKPQQ